MKSSKIGLIFKILGFGLVTFGIILTIVFMIDFNAYNFNLIRVMIFALGFPFVGIVIIIISVALNNYKVQESELKNISDKAKKILDNKTTNNSAINCEYCGCKLDPNSNKCINCGAKINKKHL